MKPVWKSHGRYCRNMSACSGVFLRGKTRWAKGKGRWGRMLRGESVHGLGGRRLRLPEPGGPDTARLYGGGEALKKEKITPERCRISLRAHDARLFSYCLRHVLNRQGRFLFRTPVPASPSFLWHMSYALESPVPSLSPAVPRSMKHPGTLPGQASSVFRQSRR